MFRAGAKAFERELDMTRRIEGLRAEQHAPHIVASLGTGEVEGRGWIAFEYLEGGSLHDRIASGGRVSPGWAVRYVSDAARALVRLHAAGVFHRDVKPANLLLGSDGKVRLGDFGLSRGLSGKLSAAGSPAFAAPEVIADDLRDGQRADVYSLGATLAYLLTAQTSHPGHPDVFAFESCGVPGPLQVVILGAMARLPERRTESAEVLLAALDELGLPLEDAPHADPSPPAAPGVQWRLGGSPSPHSGSQPSSPDPVEASASAPGSSWWNSAKAQANWTRGVAALGLALCAAGVGAWALTARTTPVELRVSEPVTGVEVRLGERDLGALRRSRTLRLVPGTHTLVAKRDGVEARLPIEVEAGRANVVPIRFRYPLRVEADEGVEATVRDSKGEPVQARAGWVLQGHPTPFEVSLPLGRYRISFSSPDHHPQSEDVELGVGGQRLDLALKPVQRFSARVPGIKGLWAAPVTADVNSDGVLDVIANGYTAHDGALVALSGRDGRLLWRFGEQTNRWATPTLTSRGEVAIGVLTPNEHPNFGLAQAAFLDPATGVARRHTTLGLSSRPPMTAHAFQLGVERGLFFVTDCQLAPPWGAATLSALREDGDFLWQRKGIAGDGRSETRHGLKAKVLRGPSGSERVLWEVGLEMIAFRPGALGEITWRAPLRGAPGFNRARWSGDFDDTLAVATTTGAGKSELLGLTRSGEVTWRRSFSAQAIPNTWWVKLAPGQPRQLVVSLVHQGSSELVIVDHEGEVLSRRRFQAERVTRPAMFRQGAQRYLAVQTLFPAEVELLDPATLNTVWKRDLHTTTASLAVADLDGDGDDALLLLYRDARFALLDPHVR